MSRNEYIQMFRLVMRALLFLVWNSPYSESFHTQLTKDTDEFMKKLGYKKKESI